MYEYYKEKLNVYRLLELKGERHSEWFLVIENVTNRNKTDYCRP